VFRGPGGAALQLGAQHSQAFESYYAHVPGLKVVTPGTAADAKGLLKSAIRDDDPVVFIEGEMLYNAKGEVPEQDEFLIPLGQAEVKRAGSDLTFICHSKTVAVALKAAEQLAGENINAEVVDLRTIRPLDTQTILESVSRTNRAVILEEGWPFAGVGAQVVDVIQREAFDSLDAPVWRVTGADVPMPYNKFLERAAKVDATKAVAAAKKVLYLE
jgi:pyruvate dehydrogenase E1 component beta subunit